MPNKEINQDELIQGSATVPSSMSRLRFDRVAASLFPEFSRARLQGWIQSGHLTIDGEVQAPKYKVSVGSLLELQAVAETLEDEAEDIPLNIVFEDEHILVINKPNGLVVHPGAGNRQGTLLNALLHHQPKLETIPRAGIVHRLDKGTTGLMVVAKSLLAQTYFVEQLQARNVSRVYEALVYGVLKRPGSVDSAIGRHRTQRTRMAIRDDGKPAITHYTSLTCFDRYTHLELALETGRTHQIRVHMHHLGHPLIGDATYGGHFRAPPGGKERDLGEIMDALQNFPRPALHAKRLSFSHPATGEACEFRAETPEDFATLLNVIERSSSAD